MRVINMRKGDGELFAPYENLSTNLFHFSATLAEKKYLKIGNREEFIEEFLELYELLNWIHPFREGNGRVQRHFWSRVASDAGWLLDWRATYVQLGEATRLAREEGDLTQLRTVFNSVVAPGRAC